MKVALVTPWDEICGIAEYGKDLVKSLPEVEFEIIGRPFSIDQARSSQADIVHLNYEPGVQGHWRGDHVSSIRNTGKKTVMTNHISNQGSNKDGLTSAFDIVVTHEKTPDDEHFVVVPAGILDWKGEVEELEAVGTSGFPFEWKCMPFVAIACNNLGLQFRAVMPESRHCDAIAAANYMRSLCPNSEIRTDWAPKEEIVPWLASCKMTVYPQKGGNNGISGSVRMGIATRKPTIISNCRMFRDLLESYPEEFYIMDTYAPQPPRIQEAIEEVLKDGKNARRPKRILEDQSWRASALKYLGIYKGLKGEE